MAYKLVIPPDYQKRMMETYKKAGIHESVWIVDELIKAGAPITLKRSILKWTPILNEDLDGWKNIRRIEPNERNNWCLEFRW